MRVTEERVKTYRINYLLVILTCGLGLPWATTAHRFKKDARKMEREGWYIYLFSKLRNYGPMVVVYRRERYE